MNALSHTFHYEDAADFIHQLEEMKRKLLSSAEQEPMQAVRDRYEMNPSQFSMRILRFKGALACTRLGGKLVSLFVTRELDAHLRRRPKSTWKRASRAKPGRLLQRRRMAGRTRNFTQQLKP